MPRKQQIELLEARGLDIVSESYSNNIFKRINYYNLINAYKFLFIDKDSSSNGERYIKKSSISEILALYEFDKAISVLFFQKILEIENLIKNTVSYIFSKNYGHRETDYLKPENFSADSNQRKLNKFLAKLNNYIESNFYKKEYISHYKNEHGYVPLWVLVNYMTLSDIIQFHDFMNLEDKRNVAKALSINNKIMVPDLEKILYTVSDYRNICAHDERFFNEQTKNTMGYRYRINTYIQNKKVQINTSTFALIMIFNLLLENDSYNKFVIKFLAELKILESKILSIELDKVLNEMGFNELKINQCYFKTYLDVKHFLLE